MATEIPASPARGWRQTSESKSLAEVHGSIAVPEGAGFWRKLFAFAGIGNPEKFFATLAEAGMPPAITRSFPDHHRYTAQEAGDLIMQAEHEGLRLVTTAKDHARMTGDPAVAALAQRAHVVPVSLKIAELEAFGALVLGALSR